MIQDMIAGQFPLDSHDCYFLLTSCRIFIPSIAVIISCFPHNLLISSNFAPISVGYDTRKMLLMGQFKYDKKVTPIIFIEKF